MLFQLIDAAQISTLTITLSASFFVFPFKCLWASWLFWFSILPQWVFLLLLFHTPLYATNLIQDARPHLHHIHPFWPGFHLQFTTLHDEHYLLWSTHFHDVTVPYPVPLLMLLLPQVWFKASSLLASIWLLLQNSQAIMICSSSDTSWGTPTSVCPWGLRPPKAGTPVSLEASHWVFSLWIHASYLTD